MTAARHFPDSYGMGRKRFRDAAKQAGADLETIQIPHANGPRDEPLYTDIARIGPAKARRVLMITSAVHGIEGLCGSGVQTGLLREDIHEALSAEVALVMVHAVNPHGFAHLRRVNEDNIDLNRNALDHSASYPDDSAYGSVHDLLCPPDLNDSKAEKDAAIDAYIDEQGERVFQAAATGGQWSHADGLFYGGQETAWSTQTLADVIARQTDGAEQIAHIDLHTGLGPYGVGEIIVTASLPGCGQRAADWYGLVTSTADGSSVSAPVRGHIGTLWEPVASRAAVTSIALEYGTQPVRDVLDALRLDNWLHLYGDVESAEGQAIKARMREAFGPDRDDWKEAVYARGVEVTRQAIAGLGQQE